MTALNPREMINVLLQTKAIIVPLLMMVLGTTALFFSTYRASDSWLAKLIPLTTVGVRLAIFGISICLGNDLLFPEQFQLRMFLLFVFCGGGITVFLHRLWLPPKRKTQLPWTAGALCRFVGRQLCVVTSVGIGFLLACIAMYRIILNSK